MEEAWVITVKDALAASNENYKRAAGAVVQAMLADRSLTQKAVGERIGRSPTWVCRLLMWHRAGCPTSTVFGPEIAMRRTIATSQSPDSTPVSDELGQLCLLGGSSTFVPGEGEATLRVFGVRAECREFIKRVRGLSRDNLQLAFQASPAETRRASLEKLVCELETSITVCGAAVGEIKAALKQIPRMVHADAAA